jgi:hypothetical protein
MKCRTTFYMALGRLLNLDFSDDDDTFDRFIQPLSSKFNLLKGSLFNYYLYDFI